MEKCIIEENADLYSRRAPFILLSIPFLFLYIFALLFSDGTCAERNVLRRLRRKAKDSRNTFDIWLRPARSFLGASCTWSIVITRVDMRNDESAARREITGFHRVKFPRERKTHFANETPRVTARFVAFMFTT